MAESLAKIALPDRSSKARFGKIADRISSLAKERNNVVHALWGREDEKIAIRMKFTGYGEVKFINARMTAVDIEKIAKSISTTSGDLYGFMVDYGLLSRIQSD